MALILCKNCGKQISDRAEKCPHCGYEQKQNTMIVCPDCGAAISQDIDICPMCGCPIYDNDNKKNEETSKSKKIKKILLLSGLGLSLMALITILIIVAVVIFGRTNRILKRVQSLIDDGLLVEATIEIDKIQDEEIKESKLSDVYSMMEKEITDLLDQNKYDEAKKLLQKYKTIRNYTELENIIQQREFDYIETEIENLMQNGDYIGAQEYLNRYSDHPKRQELQETIVYESIALQCIKSLKPSMKNPSSLQINYIEFYHIEDKPYPAVIILGSGQNGFGGYANSYSLFDTETLDLFGTCRSLDPDELKNCDLSEVTIAALILLTRSEKEKIEANCNIERINSIIQNSITPKIDVTRYANQKTIEF
jgi:RNA polymerase subunit RPABC4/transcription elongation factor Spt4